jgi:hypothetical protein
MEVMNEHFLEQKNDGNDYYELKKGTKLYRGDDRNIDVNEYKPRFFVKDIEYTKAYGKIIYRFAVKEDLKLLAIDKNIKAFYNNAPENIKTILKENYGYESGNRLSESARDNELLDYICSNTEYQGYAINKMNTLLSHFDPEITICEPGEKLTVAVKISNLSEEDSKRAQAEAKLIKNEKQRKLKRKGSQVKQYSSLIPNKFSNNLFGDDDDEPKFKPKSLLFDGGKRRKTRRNVKPSKKYRKKSGRVNCKRSLSARNHTRLSARRKTKPKKYRYKQNTKKTRKVGKKYKC